MHPHRSGTKLGLVALFLFAVVFDAGIAIPAMGCCPTLLLAPTTNADLGHWLSLEMQQAATADTKIKGAIGFTKTVGVGEGTGSSMISTSKSNRVQNHLKRQLRI